MSDPSFIAPGKAPKSSRIGQREGTYQKLLSWLSLHKPGIWRLRVDIMALMYVILGSAAILAPLLLMSFNGATTQYCGDSTRSSCVGYVYIYDVPDYTYHSGFSKNVIGWAFAFYIIASFALSLIWAFFVSRGTRLRGLVVHANLPGFLTVFLMLVPMVFLPLLAAHNLFAVTHSGNLETLLTGVADISHQGTTYSLRFPGSRNYGGWFSGYSLNMMTFGLLAALFLAISIKIILSDGVLGLVKSVIIAGIFATLTVFIGVFVFGDPNESTSVQIFLLLAFGLIYYFSFRISLIRNVRRKLSRTIGLSFCLYWIGWFPITVAYIIEGFELYNVFNDWLMLGASAAIYLLFLSMTFRDISRINLLPQP